MADTVTLSINNEQVTVPRGTLVIDAATRMGIEIPVFCSHPKLDPVACCRQCLVEMEGPRGTMLNTACNMPCMPDMVVRTDTPAVLAAQEANLAFILLHHPLDCPICDKGGECPLQDMTMRFGPGVSQLVEPKRRAQKNYNISDTIVLDQERCVICWRCVRYLEEWEEKPQLGLFERGGDTIIDVQPGTCVDAKTSGNIIDICPVGALTNRGSRFQYRPWQVERTPTISLHDPMGNNISVDTRNGTEVRRILGRENMGVNDQFITDRDRFCHHWVGHPDRLTRPLVRRGPNEHLTEVSWPEALDFAARRLQEVSAAAGSAALGAIGSAKLSNESNYLLQRMARQHLQTPNVDHRQGGDVKADLTGVPSLAPLMQPQYGPKPEADLIILFGVDPAEEIPMLDVHLKRAVSRGGSRQISIHPRKTESGRRGQALQYRPGLELALVQSLIRAALARADTGIEIPPGWSQTNPVRTGVLQADIEVVAAALVESENAVIICGPDITQQADGEQVRQALHCLATATGHAERLAFIGLDANSQGCHDMGVVPNRLPGGGAIVDRQARQRLESLWRGTLPEDAGLTYSQMLEGCGEDIKGLYVMGADPASENARWAENLDRLDLLIVQELFLTETAQRADIVLPARGWVETDGTFTNMERRVQRSPKAVDIHGSEAAPDWLILDHLCGRLSDHSQGYASVQAITAEIAEAVPAYRDIAWDSLGELGQVCARPELDARVEVPAALVEEGAPSSVALRLFRGRTFYDNSRLCTLTDTITNLIPEPYLAVNPLDLARRDIDDGSEVTASNDYGSLTVTVRADEDVAPGTAFMPEGLGSQPVGTVLNGRYWEWISLAAA